MLDPDFIPIDIFTDVFRIDYNWLSFAVRFLSNIPLIRVEETFFQGKEFVLRINRAFQLEIKDYIKSNQEKERLLNAFRKYVSMSKHIWIKNQITMHLEGYRLFSKFYIFEKLKTFLDKKTDDKWYKQKYINNFKILFESLLSEETLFDRQIYEYKKEEIAEKFADFLSKTSLDFHGAIQFYKKALAIHQTRIDNKTDEFSTKLYSKIANI